MPRTPDCPSCGRSEAQRDVKVYEGLIFNLKTFDGGVNFEANGDLCGECMRRLLLDVQKYFPGILDHGKVSDKLHWQGFITTKREKAREQQEREAQNGNGVVTESEPGTESAEKIIQTEEEAESNGQRHVRGKGAKAKGAQDKQGND